MLLTNQVTDILGVLALWWTVSGPTQLGCAVASHSKLASSTLATFAGECAEPQLRLRPARVAVPHARDRLLHLEGVQRAGQIRSRRPSTGCITRQEFHSKNYFINLMNTVRRIT